MYKACYLILTDAVSVVSEASFFGLFLLGMSLVKENYIMVHLLLIVELRDIF